MRYLLTLALIMLSSLAAAEQAIIVQLPSGEILAGVVLINGQRVPLQITVIKLNPIKPPIPAVIATHALVLVESGDSTQEQVLLMAAVRSRPDLSRKITILDKDSEDENGNRTKSVVAALKLIGNQPLPVVVGFDGEGKAVAFEPVPKDVAGVEALLKKWGVN